MLLALCALKHSTHFCFFYLCVPLYLVHPLLEVLLRQLAVLAVEQEGKGKLLEAGKRGEGSEFTVAGTVVQFIQYALFFRVFYYQKKGQRTFFAPPRSCSNLDEIFCQEL